MSFYRCTAVSLKTTALDFKGNREKILAAIQANENSSLILFPELCISGYGCEDTFYFPWVWEQSWKSLLEIAKVTSGKTVIVGLPFFQSPYLFNVSAVLQNGKILGLVPKQNLAQTGVHYENRWFTKGEESRNYTITPDGSELPFGSLLFESPDFNFGIEICEDSWVQTRPGQYLVEAGADLILSPGASHFALGKQEIRKKMFSESSRSSSTAILYANLNGNESGRLIFEGGCMGILDGSVKQEGPRLHFTDFESSHLDLNSSELRSNRARNFRSSGTKEFRSRGKGLQRIEILPLKVQKNSDTSVRVSESDLFQDFTRATSLGLFDYLIKSKTKGYTLSLSGGADSATCALLVKAAILFSEKELGPKFLGSLGLDPKNLLYTLFQGTENNSEQTKNSAKQLSEELGFTHAEITVDSEVRSMLDKISSVKGIVPNWKDHNLALQNIQARVRSPLVWLLANLNGHLLLSTGNRSEASVGYTTMDGDSSGSVAPLTGVSKEFILSWLKNVHEGKDIILPKINALEDIVHSKPTAELKPLSEKQEDEKDLMPYPLLQKLERNFVYLGKSPDNLLESQEWPNAQEAEEGKKKFLKLFSASQWKRERLPPSFHLDEYGLDPKSSFRFPILSEISF
ncbi:NAD(+) synthase [Leptospira licerasiae]|uniref:Glutamine-dependent NAD(+) synthetase n=1 Tax=Leptospira licerasiae str. MMD4847 TaxID=1049971 RepID=A0ABN0H8A2_9LEPT|nr:NAD(+) synthase [Leptospira licerasiae]EID99990.1 NAD+ synthetase [Leptospira licerasiae serovar Varillal str. VAR 010]EJZ41798.1 NAD+ synthetase [Leptospira licerasiae str. MMD4847]